MKNKIRVLLSQLFIRLFSRATFIHDATYNKILYWIRTGKKANLAHPETFNEHVLFLKINQEETSLTTYSDKYLVRNYVKETIGEEYLVPMLGVWDKAEDIEFEKLPQKCILKATHGSGWNQIIRGGREVDWEKIRVYFSKVLKSNYYYKSRERNYKDITPRVLAETLLEPSGNTGIIDFKVFCFDSVPRFFSVSYRDENGDHYGLFDNERKEIPLRHSEKTVEQKEIPEETVSHIYELAHKLSQPFPFVRVDFYLCNGDIKFSELTFHSGGGIRPIEPDETAKRLGNYFVN